MTSSVSGKTNAMWSTARKYKNHNEIKIYLNNVLFMFYATKAETAGVKVHTSMNLSSLYHHSRTKQPSSEHPMAVRASVSVLG